MPFQVGLPEILALLLLALLIFGPGRITKVARELGSSVRAFREGLQGESKGEQEKEKESTQDKA